MSAATLEPESRTEVAKLEALVSQLSDELNSWGERLETVPRSMRGPNQQKLDIEKVLKKLTRLAEKLASRASQLVEYGEDRFAEVMALEIALTKLEYQIVQTRAAIGSAD